MATEREDLWVSASAYLKERQSATTRLANEFSNARYFLVILDAKTIILPLAWATSALTKGWRNWTSSENTGHAQRKAEEAGLEKITFGSSLHEELWQESLKVCVELRTTFTPHLRSGFSMRKGVNRSASHNTYFLYPRVLTTGYSSFLKQELEFQDQVRAAASATRDKRLLRLKEAKRKPNKRLVLTSIFDRNPDVVAERLEVAAGKCERCYQAAPFIRRSDKTPYLEVHHKQTLAEGGEDIVENTIALCPNCHREAHYG